MIPLYKYSFETAKRDNEIQEFRESFQENIRCRDYLDNEVSERFDSFHLPVECLENTVKEFGFDRTMWVLANTILERKGDGRFNRDNKDWARKLNIPQWRNNYEFALNSHSCIVDGMASDVRKMYAALGLFSGEHIVQTDEPQDYTGKLVILRDTALKRNTERRKISCSSHKADSAVPRKRSAKRCSDVSFRTEQRGSFTDRISSA